LEHHEGVRFSLRFFTRLADLSDEYPEREVNASLTDILTPPALLSFLGAFLLSRGTMDTKSRPRANFPLRDGVLIFWVYTTASFGFAGEKSRQSATTCFFWGETERKSCCSINNLNFGVCSFCICFAGGNCFQTGKAPLDFFPSVTATKFRTGTRISRFWETL